MPAFELFVFCKTKYNMKMEKNRKKFIGVFDSGFGGLDVLRGIVQELPDYDYMYLGDSERVPYGNRKKDEIYDFSRQAVDFLFRKKCSLIIFACNTASAGALRRIQREYLPKKYPNKKVLGVLIPAAEVAAKRTKNKKIGIIATERTVSSKAFRRELLKIDEKVEIFQKSCPLLVPLVEAGKEDLPRTEVILEKYLQPLLEKKIDTLILGCTHYGILKKKIAKIVGKKVNIICEADVIGKKLKDYLERHSKIEKTIGKNKKISFFSTDLSSGFEKIGSRFFRKKIMVKKAVIF